MNAFKEIREKIGLSREELADKLNITVGAIANYESDNPSTHRDPRIDIAYSLLDVCRQRGFSYVLEDIYPREG